ncbi:PH domain-containing protein [Aeribacillus sp. FSL K6-1305]|uniref:PH domain-containing protein n=1 Tax=Aeribacillus sp. FSL K6-1305 TaxID=2954569 RepID=UPI0030FDAEFF
MNNEITNDQARRIHPLWIFFLIGKSIKELVLFVITFIIYIRSDSDSILIKITGIAIVFYLIYKIVSILLEWFHFKYLFTNKELYIHEGRFIKEKRYIPLERIQGIKRTTPFFHRLFGLTSLILDTGASGNKSTIKLGMITCEEAERIQKHLSHISSFHKDKGVSEQNVQTSKEIAPELSSRKKYYEMTSKEIFVASVTSLSLLIFLSVLYTIYDNVSDFFSIDSYIDTVISFFQKSWLLTFLGIVALLMLSMAYGWARTYVIYRNFEVTGDNQRIYIRKGLFNQTEFSIPKEKVEAIILNTKLLKKILGIVEVKIISTGDGDENEMKTANILFPFIDKRRALSLIPQIFPAFHVETEMVNLPRSAIFVKLVRTSYIWIIAAAINFYFWPNFWYISVALFVLINTSQLLSGLYSCYNLCGPFIQIQTGSFSTKLFITTRMKIEELKVTESLLQRMFGLASLEISTRSKSIQVSKISDIPKDMATRYYQWYANKENH